MDKLWQLDPWALLGWGILSLIGYGFLRHLAAWLGWWVKTGLRYWRSRHIAPAIGQVWEANGEQWEIIGLHEHHFTFKTTLGCGTLSSPMRYEAFSRWRRRNWAYLRLKHS